MSRVAAIDCGRAVNPEIVIMQMESAIAFGLTAALEGEINFVAGSVVERNFDAYRILRMTKMPDIEVHLVKSERAPAGVGEPGKAAWILS